jgi:hypothetical protein
VIPTLISPVSAERGAREMIRKVITKSLARDVQVRLEELDYQP